jgi:HEAT repeat protein
VTPMARRDQVRAFLNGGPTQVGTALAGVVGLIGERTLSTTQLSIVGIVLAALTLFLAWRIRAAYTGALVAALRAGRPLIFDRSPLRGSPITIENDAETLRVLAEASRDDDASVRRLAVSLLGESDGAAAVHRLRDAVRDPDPDVRRQAVEALGNASPATDGNAAIPSETMDDDDVAVAATAAALSLDGPDRDRALARLTNALAGDDEVAQSAALRALRHAPASDAADLAAPFLSHANPTLRDEALLVVSEVRPDRALPRAIEMLDRDGAHAPAAAATAVQRANAAAVEPVLNILQAKPLTPVVLDVLSRLDARAQPSMVEAFVRDRTAIASRDRDLSAGIDDDDDVAGLLRDALLGRGRRHARAAFLALASISDDPDAIRASVDSLDAVDHGQVANALETLEAAIDRETARQLIALWEPEGRPGARTDIGAIERAAQDEDELIRLCAESVRGRAKGEDDVRTRQVSSIVERLLFLRKVAIFSQLDPADLHAIARAAEDHTFADGEHLADEGELGDRLHIIVSGAVRVVRHDGAMEIAQRGPGEVVGEMSLVSNEPRMATLIAVGDVRTVSLGRLEFQGIIRERPDVGLSVMKVLASRLTEAARPGSTTEEVA